MEISHMPGVNNSGPSAAARIRVLESRKGHSLRLPIVGLSADVQTTARALCISSGMDDYLSKPRQSTTRQAPLSVELIPNRLLQSNSKISST
jgi:CheY-like chemotaxis protein